MGRRIYPQTSLLIINQSYFLSVLLWTHIQFYHTLYQLLNPRLHKNFSRTTPVPTPQFKLPRCQILQLQTSSVRIFWKCFVHRIDTGHLHLIKSTSPTFWGRTISKVRNVSTQISHEVCTNNYAVCHMSRLGHNLSLIVKRFNMFFRVMFTMFWTKTLIV